MKVYLDDEKTHVDPCPHNGHSVGWTVMTETIVLVIDVWPKLKILQGNCAKIGLSKTIFR